MISGITLMIALNRNEKGCVRYQTEHNPWRFI